MFEVIRKIWKTGVVTHKLPLREASQRYRGKLDIQPHKCKNCGACVAACPAGAINVAQKGQGQELSIAYTKCIFCGLCASVCKVQAVQMTNDYHLATKNKNDLIQVVRMPQ
ncbi:MAG: 4Fe-4S dicluster domain-containing protein [Pelosinus sp.]|nr:4Fe-4S dicluster domain-containing protein [Pelosinus sp.]